MHKKYSFILRLRSIDVSTLLTNSKLGKTPPLVILDGNTDRKAVFIRWVMSKTPEVDDVGVV